MSRAYVLMTAMPPTKGHLNLIKFAQRLAGTVIVIVCTQPHEPYANERYMAVHNATKFISGVTVAHLHTPLEQNPEAPGFWDMWVKIMRNYGFQPGDYCVTSEPYGQTMAELLDGKFRPYDPKRELYYTKATNIRDHLTDNFGDIMRAFQPNLRKTVTVFGAESTGKTTLSHQISVDMNGHWLFEYARPYLETVGPEITVDSMTGIWEGQAALQRHAEDMYDKPWVVQDTDLFSTVGYWQFPHWQNTLGEVPARLVSDALELKSDLYIITRSNIPFEEDPLRYGGDKREGSDEYWIDVADQYNLNYRILNSRDKAMRELEAIEIMTEFYQDTVDSISYDRQGY